MLLQRLRDAGKTIIVSSHILAELEDYSNWMLTLDGGKLKGLVPVHAAPGTGLRWLRVKVASDPAAARAAVEAIEGVQSVMGEGPLFELAWSRDEEAQAELLRELVVAGVRVVSLEVASARMQDVYLAQVGLERGSSHES